MPNIIRLILVCAYMHRLYIGVTEINLSKKKDSDNISARNSDKPFTYGNSSAIVVAQTLKVITAVCNTTAASTYG